MRNIFGWDLPPGVSMRDIDPPESPCAVCGEFADNCICPDCPRCGCQGDPSCYERHGMTRSAEQRLLAAWNAALEKDQIRREAKNYEEGEYE